MTVAYGFGMLAVGLIAIGIGSLIIFGVINKMQRNEKKKKEDEEIQRRLHGG